jgi:hypothetical protein
MPSFSPDSDYTPEFRRFLQRTEQPADTGIRLGYTLWQHELPWGHLVRTNVRNPHYLIAGIYGGIVFHLGSASRRTVFRQDFRQSRIHRLTRSIDRIPVGTGALLTARKMLTRAMRGDVEDLLLISNQATFDALFRYLVSDPEGFIAYLRGGEIPLSYSPAARSGEGGHP